MECIIIVKSTDKHNYFMDMFYKPLFETYIYTEYIQYIIYNDDSVLYQVCDTQYPLAIWYNLKCHE